jgi:hypothetical protein
MKKIKCNIREKLHEALFWVRMDELAEAENTIHEIEKSIFMLGDNIRKELEGRFVHGAIKHSEKYGHDVPFVIGRRKRLGKLYQVSIIVTEIVENNGMPKMTCPKCGSLHDDFDGLSFSYCPACGYCSHPNSTIENGREICGICGKEINRGGV